MCARDATRAKRPARSGAVAIHVDAAADSDARPVSPNQAASGQPRLRLITPPNSPLSSLVGGIEGEFAASHRAMLARLSRLEAALAGPRAVDIAGAQEQIAFVRVGFRCIADAIGELAEHASRLDVDGGQRPVPSDRGPA